jgi:acyl carrier protein
MTRDEVRAQVVGALCEVAPEVDPARVRADVPLRDQLDLDSMDYLRFLIEVDRRLQVSVPEADYARLESLDDVVDYVLAAQEG